jgi:hypothetical protein
MSTRTWIRRLFAKRAATPRPAVRRRPRRAPLQVEALETRLTPTGNLAITGISVVDQNDHPLSTVNPGQWVSIQANFTTTNLPSNAWYRVSFMVNGLTSLSIYVNWSAGVSGTNNASMYWGSFLATPGTNQVTVTLDPDPSVVETTYADNSMSTTFNAVPPAAQSWTSYTAAQIRNAYGINSIPNFGTAAPDGSGQTIALVEAYNDPTILADLDGYDHAMSLTTTGAQSLYQQYGAASSFVHVYNQSGVDITANILTSGQNGVPPVDPTGAWEGEETMDVEWAHAIAPGAKIDIIECSSDWFAGDNAAAGLPGVSAVSNSWGGSEWSGQTGHDAMFTTPSGHTGITFLACSGDAGANMYSGSSIPTPVYPATSPNVVSVGGTQLTLNNNAYASETGWSLPALATTVTKGSSGYSQQGTWTSQTGGFSGNYSTAAGGSASTAAWTIAVTPANEGWLNAVAVSATWTAASGNATNATYTVYDGTGTSGTVLGTVVVDQTKAPLGTADGSWQFQELGSFFPTLDSNKDGTLTVVLNASSAKGTVVADALGTAHAWATTGGPSSVEKEPAYQQAVQNTGFRATPNVSFDGSGNSGVDIYIDGGMAYGAAGTSLSSPCWAGLIAIANQGRVAGGASTLNSPTNPQQTLQALYNMPAADFNDITTGYNGYSAGPGYDFVTGRGSPVANTLIPDLTNYATQTAGLSGPSDGVLYQPRTFTFTANGSAGDNAAGYTYAINWGDGSPVQTVTATAGNTSITLSHAYTQTGTFTVSATATDQFGYTAPAGSQSIAVSLFAIEADPAGQGGITGLAISDVAGTSGVVLTPTGSGDNLQVTRGGVLLGTFTAPGGVVAIYGDGGTDLVTLNGLSSSANTITLSGNTATLTAAGLPPAGFSVGLSGISNITLHGGSNGNTFTFTGTSMGVPATIQGGGTANTVVGPNLANVWNITSANAGNLNGASWSFTGIQNLTGGNQSNDFIFSKGATLSGSLNGGGGGTLDESAFTTAVTVNLQTHKATGITGTFSNMTEFFGGSAKNTLIGANVADTFDIYSLNDCAVNNIVFFGFANLAGGTVSNDFVFADGSGVTGKITGAGTGVNALDYSAYTTGIYVNLHTGKATGTGGISKINAVAGGSGSDILVGYGSGILLVAGSGNDLLIGGSGQATIESGAGQDIVIAGSTSYDTNAAALQAIENYWSNTTIDEGTRVNQLTTAGVGGYRLTTTTVKHAAASDVLDLFSPYDWAFWRQSGTDADTLGAFQPDFSTFF